MYKLYKALLHNGIESARRLLQNKHLGIGHKHRDDGKLLLNTKAHSLGFTSEHLVVKFKAIGHFPEPPFVVYSLHILHHSDKIASRQSRRQCDLTGNISDLLQYLIIFIEGIETEDLHTSRIRL